MGFIDKILHEDEENVTKAINSTPVEKPSVNNFHIDWRDVAIFFLIVLVSVVAGCYVLFKVTNPENAGVENWYSDTYHHWQIAYLSKEVGFSHGFLRLWDLKGLEYFWGLMHPLIGSALIGLTGSTDIIVFRLLSVVTGSIAIGFLFLIVKKYWGYSSAIATSLIGIFNPVVMFNIASGMVEPMGIMFMLAGIYFIDDLPFLGGFLLAFAAATRAEYWILSGLIVLITILFKNSVQKKVAFFLGYAIPVLLYMKYLLNYTGNAIYPIWWNYLGNAAGAWEANIPPTTEQLFIQKIYWLIALISFAGAAWAIKAGKKYLPLMLFGFGNWFLWGVTIGMTKYLLSYLPRFWVDRIMLWPYLFVAALFSIAIFYFAPRAKHFVLKAFLHSFSWLVVVGVIIASQVLWQPIWHYYSDTESSYSNDYNMGKFIYTSIGPDGKIAILEYWPPLTYMLVHFGGIKGERLVSEMYDPYFYIKGDPYNDWGNNRKLVLDWVKKENIQYIVFTGTEKRYIELVRQEPAVFTEINHDTNWNIYIYRTNFDLISI